MENLYDKIFYDDIIPPKSFIYEICKKEQISKEKLNYDPNDILNECKYNLSPTYNGDLLNYLTIANTAFISHYGYNINEKFFEVLKNTNIYFEKGEADNIAEKYDLYADADCLGYYFPAEPINVFKDYSNKKEKANIVVSRNQTYIDSLNTLIHELRHALTSDSYYMSKDIYYLRQGLCEQFLTEKYDTDVLSNILDEVFNCHFSDNMVTEVLKYKKANIDDIELKKILNSFKTYIKTGLYYKDAYDIARIITYPLIKNEELTNLADKVAMNGNLFELNDYFTNRDVDYIEYSNLLDDFFEEEKEENIYKIKQMSRKLL